jgi:hypothetical protein
MSNGQACLAVLIRGVTGIDLTSWIEWMRKSLGFGPFAISCVIVRIAPREKVATYPKTDIITAKPA